MQDATAPSSDPLRLAELRLLDNVAQPLAHQAHAARLFQAGQQADHGGGHLPGQRSNLGG